MPGLCRITLQNGDLSPDLPLIFGVTRICDKTCQTDRPTRVRRKRKKREIQKVVLFSCDTLFTSTIPYRRLPCPRSPATLRNYCKLTCSQLVLAHSFVSPPLTAHVVPPKSLTILSLSVSSSSSSSLSQYLNILSRFNNISLLSTSSSLHRERRDLCCLLVSLFTTVLFFFPFLFFLLSVSPA